MGTVGVIPKQLPDENKTSGVEKRVHVGDHIFMVGGASEPTEFMGRLFLHWNSTKCLRQLQCKSEIPSHKNECWIFCWRLRSGSVLCVTDNGAGGLSSSVGEMATLCGGAILDLSKAPTKYPNLQPWQLMIPESQERMTVAVSPKTCTQFEELAKRRGVVVTAMGNFTDSGNLVVTYDEALVALIRLTFLHDSLSPMKIPAFWNGPMQRNTWISRNDRKDSTKISWKENFIRYCQV